MATLLVNEQGYHGASIDKISTQLHVTKGSSSSSSSYHHHNNNDNNEQDLIFTCFERTFAVLRCGLSLAE